MRRRWLSSNQPLVSAVNVRTARPSAPVTGVSLPMEQNAVQTLAIAHRAYIIENGHVAMQGRAADLARDPELRRNYLGL